MDKFIKYAVFRVFIDPEELQRWLFCTEISPEGFKADLLVPQAMLRATKTMILVKIIPANFGKLLIKASHLRCHVFTINFFNNNLFVWTFLRTMDSN